MFVFMVEMMMSGCKMGLLIIVGLILMECLLSNNGVDGVIVNNNKKVVGVLFIFGDLLVDVGNNNYLFILFKVNFCFNGMDYKFFGGKFIGWFINGWIIGDIVGMYYFFFFMNMVYVINYSMKYYIFDFYFWIFVCFSIWSKYKYFSFDFILIIFFIDMSWLVVGEELGMLNYVVLFLDLNVIGKLMLYGVNYVFGGGGIFNVIGSIFVWMFF